MREKGEKTNLKKGGTRRSCLRQGLLGLQEKDLPINFISE